MSVSPKPAFSSLTSSPSKNDVKWPDRPDGETCVGTRGGVSQCESPSLGLVGVSERSTSLDSVRISRKEGVSVRNECAEQVRIDQGRVDFVRTRAKTWAECLDRWEAWIERYEDLGIRFVDTVTGKTVTGDLETSFSKNYAKKQYARFCSLEDGVAEEFENPTTIMLSFTASNRFDDGSYRPPVDHINEIARVWRNNVRQQLKYTVEEKMNIDDWAYGTVIEPHKSGYAHPHVAVFIDGDCEASDFQSVINTHVKHCEFAQHAAHRVDPSNPRDSAVSVNDQSGIRSLAKYLSKYLGDGVLDGPLQKPRYIRRFCAMVWASGLRRIRFNDRGYELMNIGEEIYRGKASSGSSGSSGLTRPGSESDPNEEPEPDFDRAEVIIPQDEGDPEIRELMGGKIRRTEIKNTYWDEPDDHHLVKFWNQVKEPDRGPPTRPDRGWWQKRIRNGAGWSTSGRSRRSTKRSNDSSSSAETGSVPDVKFSKVEF